MQLVDFGLIASALQLYVARHAHAHILRGHRTPNYVLSSDIGSTPEAIFTRSTTSLYFLEADVDIKYQGVYTTMSAPRQSTNIPLGGQYRASLQPTVIGPHHHIQVVPTEGWIGKIGANFTSGFGNHPSAVHRPTFYSIATPLTNASLKASNSRVGTKGTPKSHTSFSSSGSHGRRASRVAMIVILLILTGATLSIWS